MKSGAVTYRVVKTHTVDEQISNFPLPTQQLINKILARFVVRPSGKELRFELSGFHIYKFKCSVTGHKYRIFWKFLRPQQFAQDQTPMIVILTIYHRDDDTYKNKPEELARLLNELNKNIT